METRHRSHGLIDRLSLTGSRSEIVFDQMFQLIAYFLDHVHVIDAEEILETELILVTERSLPFPFLIDIQ